MWGKTARYAWAMIVPGDVYRTPKLGDSSARPLVRVDEIGKHTFNIVYRPQGSRLTSLAEE